MPQYEKNSGSENALLKDGEWSAIDSKLCRVIRFNPFLASVKNGKVITGDKTTPYASVTLECEDDHRYNGFITQKIDFINL